MQSYCLIITGLIQGIGFRPFIYNLAHRLGINGYVLNRSDAVEILVQGTEECIGTFCETVKNNPPALARIDTFNKERIITGVHTNFLIMTSRDSSDAVTDISADIAVCEHCLKDMREQSHRLKYPLINCTLCGPRFTIIKAVPYDRPNTTMASFSMCRTCADEYGNPADRRFHAQPVACNHCGPVYSMYEGSKHISGNTETVERTAKLLNEGAVVAIKGTGGFHLACNPFTKEALIQLRSGKRRDGKPFALMFRDIDTLREYALVNDNEEKLLESAMHPIVLLSGKGEVVPDVTNHLSTIGAMLPYMPFHYLLFEQLPLPALVMTSGNISEEPIVIDNDRATTTFDGIADAVIVYNRDIYNRVDDSICAVFGDSVQILRRSRGFAPSPVSLAFPVDRIAAAGAELKNCFALGKRNKAIMSQHIGDLKNSETLEFYEEAFSRFCSLFRVEPNLFVHDTHPDYLSTMFALKSGLPTLPVQHHHAHIAACCAENGINEPVIGVALDGSGYGEDGTIWGGEFLVADFNEYRRMAHLRYVDMTGGDLAATEPWRMAGAYLSDTFGESFLTSHHYLLKSVDEDRLMLFNVALQKKINTIQTSSMGRLFDAVAALCGVCSAMSFEAEAAMRLEALCKDTTQMSPYPWKWCAPQIDVREMIVEICTARKQGIPVTTIVTRFHTTIINIIITMCNNLREATGNEIVVLSGGCFQNRCIFKGCVERLKKNKFQVYTHHFVPCNDGGIALGQLAVAAHIH